jgi:hypothetical protein
VTRRKAPVRASGGGYLVELDTEEAALVRRLLAELRALLTDPSPAPEARQLLLRLFPVVHPDDPDAEAEYQRLMRDELVQSRLGAIAAVDDLLGGDEPPTPVGEEGVVALMQSINSIRLVLGAMLGVTDDLDDDEVEPGLEDTPEYQLYAYLSWLLEHCVRALSE